MHLNLTALFLPELALLVAEEEEEVGAVASVDDVEDGLARVLVHHAGEDDELDGVQDDRAVRLARRFAVQPGTFLGR